MPSMLAPFWPSGFSANGPISSVALITSRSALVLTIAVVSTTSSPKRNRGLPVRSLTRKRKMKKRDGSMAAPGLRGAPCDP